MNSKILHSFRILELEPDASLDQVKKAWRQLAKVWHPDLFPNNSELQHKAQEKLKAINNAYEILEEYFKSGGDHQFEDSSEQAANNSTEQENDPPQDDLRGEPQPKKSRQLIILLLSVIALLILVIVVILVKNRADVTNKTATGRSPVTTKLSNLSETDKADVASQKTEIKTQAPTNQLVQIIPVEDKFLPSETNVGKVYTPPVITQQPKNQSAYVGANVTFKVAVSGTGPFSYQWQFNGTNLPNVGIITTVVGNGRQVSLGDGGAATNAILNYPYRVAVDVSGNLFIADSGNHRIRKVFTNGIITTVAGNGSAGYFGDGGAAINAALHNPHGLAVDSGNQRIRKVSTKGIITTVAGNGTQGYSGDGGAATDAAFRNPASVAVDTGGNLFIGDNGNNRIRKVSTNGIITTVVGTGQAGYSGDGAAIYAGLQKPCGVAVDASGNLFFADFHNNCIRKVSTSGIITTVAGNGTKGYSGDGGAATNATLRYPKDVAVDANGNLLIADTFNQCIRKVYSTDQPNLNLTSVRAGMAGNYSVIITGAGGSVTSSVARLTLLPGIAR